MVPKVSQLGGVHLQLLGGKVLGGQLPVHGQGEHAPVPLVRFKLADRINFRISSHQDPVLQSTG